VPFLRSTINGLDSIYKAYSGRMSMADRMTLRKDLWTRGGILAGVTLMYAMAAEDEEWYRDATPRERYSNFFLPLPGVDEPLRIPIPFELGLIFKALPEAMYEQLKGKEETGDALKALKDMLLASVPNPMPQMFKPAVEVAMNRSFFTGRDIETKSMQGLAKEDRYGSTTTETAKMLGSMLPGLSPVQIEHLTRGYFGPLGIAMMAAIDASLDLAPPGVEAPDKRLSESKIFGSMFQPSNGQNVLEKAYNLSEEYGQQAKSFKKAEEEGNLDRLADFINDPEKMLTVDLDKDGRAMRKALAELAQQERTIRGMPGMSGPDKAAVLANLREVKRLHAQALFQQDKALR
jgi:hypothetical protein